MERASADGDATDATSADEGAPHDPQSTSWCRRLHARDEAALTGPSASAASIAAASAGRDRSDSGPPVPWSAADGVPPRPPPLRRSTERAEYHPDVGTDDQELLDGKVRGCPPPPGTGDDGRPGRRSAAPTRGSVDVDDAPPPPSAAPAACATDLGGRHGDARLPAAATARRTRASRLGDAAPGAVASAADDEAPPSVVVEAAGARPPPPPRERTERRPESRDNSTAETDGTAATWSMTRPTHELHVRPATE